MMIKGPWISGAAAMALSVGMGTAASAATEVQVIVSHYSDQTAPIFEADCAT